MDSNPLKKIHILHLALIFLLITNIADGYNLEKSDERPLAIHKFLLESVSWKSIPISCLAGDSLSGEFTLTSNGDLFIGDQTKYDNWLLDGIDFLIIDSANYGLWIDGLSTTSLYERNGVFELSWNVEIPSDGIWYIIYYNNSIFMKQVEGSIQHISGSGFTFIFIVILLGTVSFLSSIFMFRKKNERPWQKKSATAIQRLFFSCYFFFHWRLFRNRGFFLFRIRWEKLI